MSQFYTPEYIDENYPEHCRTSCSDEHPINAEVNGHGCLRCNALLFQKQEAEHEEITRLRAELAKVTWQRNEARADLAASRAESERLSSMIDHQRDEAMEMERMLRDELRALMERAYCGGYASGRMSRAAVKQESGE